MDYKVTNVKEVNYLGMSEKERKEIWRLDDLRFQQMTTCFYDEGEYFALYEDLDSPADKTTNDSTYAVYLGKSRELVCLLVDAGIALTIPDWAEFGEKRSELYKQIALAAGWPEKLPYRHMTWRDLLDELKKQPDEVLDMPAYVNVTQSTWDGLHEVTELTTWNGVGEVDLEENQLLINFVEDSFLD